MKKSDKKLRRKIGVLVILGILTAILLPINVSAGDDSDWTGVGGSTLYLADNTDDVGIGDTTPSHQLEILDISTTANRAGLYVAQTGAPGSGDTIYGLYVTKTGAGAGDNVAGYFSASEATGNNYGLIVENGRIGFGDTSPDFKLEVTGSSGSGYFGVSSTDDNIDNGDIFVITDGGNVGIGIVSFSAKVHILQTTAADAFRVDDESGDSTPFVIGGDGNVGIGVTSPAEKLEVNGNMMFSTGADRTMYVETPFLESDGYDLTIESGDANWVSSYPGKIGGSLYLGGGDGNGIGGGGGDVYIYGGDKGPDSFYGNVVLAHTGSAARGNVGIGTYPRYPLEVRGALGLSYSVLAETTIATESHGYLIILPSGQNVGIGTASPNHGVHIVDNTNAAGRAGLYVSQVGAPTSGRTLYGSYVTNTGSGTGYNVGGYFSATGADNNYGLIVENGDVGIGTGSPTAKAHIVQTATTGVTDCFRVDDEASDTSPFVIDKDGYVSIGKQGPAAPLDILKPCDSWALRAQNNLYGGGSCVYLAHGNGYGAYIDAGPLASSLTYALNVNGQGNPYLFVRGDGNVGIGDTDPDATLEIVESGTTPFMISNGAGGDGDFMIMDTSGNVGIGAVSPSTKLHVDGDVAFGKGSDLEVDDAGEITVTHSYHYVDDDDDYDLDTIIGGNVAGQIIIIQPKDATPISVIDGLGNILLTSNFEMDNVNDTLVLICDGTNWNELSRSDNG